MEISGAFKYLQSWLSSRSRTATTDVLTWRQQYDILRSYYYNNSLYDALRTQHSALAIPDIALKSLRNPIPLVVEFYADLLWPGVLPGALPIETNNERILDPIDQLWRWSNWNVEKQALARTFPLLGDMFLKIATRLDRLGEQRVYMQSIDPGDVTTFEADERGYLTYVRIDVAKTAQITHTEVWDKQAQIYRRWEHQQGVNAPLERLPNPVETLPFVTWGIDFIPLVWQPFRATGAERGMAAFVTAIDEIDEANRQATRLAQMLFRHGKPLWAATTSGTDSTGRPIPPPQVGGLRQQMSDDPKTDDIISLNGELTALVPNIPYGDALAILNAQLDSVRLKLPEITYAEIIQKGEMSNVALQTMLKPAISRLLEARANAEAGLIRAQQMALTIGRNLGVWEGIGSYETGELNHTFAARPVIEPSPEERATTLQTLTAAGVPLLTAAKMAGYSEREITEIDRERTKDRADEQRLNQQQASALAVFGVNGNGRVA